MLQRLIGEDIMLRTRLLPGGAWIEGDSGMIEQVLLNLAVNARDAMPGGGELWIELDDVTLDEAAARQHPEGRPGSFICLSLRDTGRGIAPDHLPHIFEPFFTTKEVGKGTGLGLARCTASSSSITVGLRWKAIPARGRRSGFTCHACPKASTVQAARPKRRGCLGKRIHPRG